MSSIFVRPRSHSHELLNTAKRASGGALSSLVVVGIGTAGGRRALMFLQRMSELSAIRRVQSAVFYDCNEITVNHVQKFLRKFLGGVKNEAGIQILFPNFIPLSNGFMRDPERFREYLGPMERDMDSMINQIMLQSERCGRPPEVIIEFMSFAGHAIVGGHLHQKLRAMFPAAVILPVMMLPKDHVSAEWTRRCIWEQYENFLEGSNCLVTTQPAGHAGEDDLRLSTGLAGFAVADYEESEETTVGNPLGGTLRRLAPASGGWLGMAVVKRKVPVVRKFEWLRFPPWWQQYAALGSEDELSRSLGHAIWSTLDPSAQMAEGVDCTENAPQEVVISMPVHGDALEPVAAEAAEVLERSSIFEQFPNMDIAFNTARFVEGVTKEPYMHITRIYPISGELTPVRAILHPDVPPEGRGRSAVRETGFGSHYHLRGSAAAGALFPDNGDFDGDGPQRALYF